MRTRPTFTEVLAGVKENLGMNPLATPAAPFRRMRIATKPASTVAEDDRARPDCGGPDFIFQQPSDESEAGNAAALAIVILSSGTKNIREKTAVGERLNLMRSGSRALETFPKARQNGHVSSLKEWGQIGAVAVTVGK